MLPRERTDIKISSSYSFVKAMISLVQIIYAFATLYRTRGNQLKQYGYAAYGLTMIPHIIMSVFNLAGNMMTHDFPTIYMVRSSTMTRAEGSSRGGNFGGVVSIVEEISSVGEVYSVTADHHKDIALQIVERVERERKEGQCQGREEIESRIQTNSMLPNNAPPNYPLDRSGQHSGELLMKDESSTLQPTYHLQPNPSQDDRFLTQYLEKSNNYEMRLSRTFFRPFGWIDAWFVSFLRTLFND